MMPSMRTMQWVRTFAMMVLIQIGTVPAAFASTTPQRYEFSRLEMGTLFRVVVYATSPEAAEKGAYAALDRVQELNGSLSDYLEDSELNQLCRTAYESPSVVSRELFFVLERALEISRKTDGAFDISIGPLVKLWRKCGSEGKLPDPAQIRTALSRIGYQKILLNRMTRSVRLREPNMKIDLGGIAKGYALDEAMRILKEQGLAVAMVDGGGDLKIGDPPPGAKGWKVELAKDWTGKPHVLYLSNIAVATSGDLYRYYQIDGERYSHIVDPTTGLGLKHSPQVTVLAPNGIDADALATAVSVMNPAQGINLIERLPKTEARITVVHHDRMVSCETSGFPP